jgi:hypothetical protein
MSFHIYIFSAALLSGVQKLKLCSSRTIGAVIGRFCHDSGFDFSNRLAKLVLGQIALPVARDRPSNGETSRY